mgnify:CR=1 FL=1
MRTELYTVVDQGGIVVDVAVENPLYGELRGNLNLASRYDVDHFIQQAAAPAEFFVQLIAAYAGKVITFVIKEGCFNKCGGIFQSRRFARAQLFINFN